MSLYFITKIVFSTQLTVVLGNSQSNQWVFLFLSHIQDSTQFFLMFLLQMASVPCSTSPSPARVHEGGSGPDLVFFVFCAVALSSHCCSLIDGVGCSPCWLACMPHWTACSFLASWAYGSQAPSPSPLTCSCTTVPLVPIPPCPRAKLPENSYHPLSVCESHSNSPAAVRSQGWCKTLAPLHSQASPSLIRSQQENIGSFAPYFPTLPPWGII